MVMTQPYVVSKPVFTQYTINEWIKLSLLKWPLTDDAGGAWFKVLPA